MVSFWSSVVEATYLTLRPFSLSSSIAGGSSRAATALAIVNEKTKLVSVTTFTDTISNVVLASSMGLVLSEDFGPIGWIYSAVLGSLAIMTLLYLLPKAIGIENALRMSVSLAPSTRFVLRILSPVALPLTSFARAFSRKLVGSPTYNRVDLVGEFEDVVGALEQAGNIEPDSGRLLRTALKSSRVLAVDAATTAEDVVSVPRTATVLEALESMGKTGHPRMPVYDHQRKRYVGVVTFRHMTKALSRGLLETKIDDYIVQPAMVQENSTLAVVMETMQDAGTTMAFVYSSDTVVGVLTMSDIIGAVMGVKV